MEVEKIAEILAYVLIGIGLGPILSLGITPVFCLLRTIFYVPFIRERLLEEAQKKGHVVVAMLQKSRILRNHPAVRGALPNLTKMGIYTYQVNGRKYTYRFVSTDGLDNTLTLYYIKKARKATVGGDLGNWEWPLLKSYLIISLLVAVATVFVGMIMG